MNTKTVNNYIYNMIYQVVYLFAPLVITPYISRVLGAQNIGIYSYTNSVVSYFVMFASLGLTSYGIREIAYNQNNRERVTDVFYNVQALKLILSLIVLLVFVGFINITDNYTLVLCIQGLLIIANFFDITWFFQGLENFKIIVLRNIIIKVIGIVLVFVFVKQSDDLPIYTAIQVLTILVGNVSLWFALPRNISRLRLNNLAPFKGFKEVIELFFPVVAVQVYNVLDKTMVGNTGMMNESGYYEQTTKTVLLAMAFITSISGVISPRMSAKYSENDIDGFKSSVRVCFNLVVTMACPICFGLMAVADGFVDCFFGSNYEPVKMLIRLYGLTLLIIPLSNLAAYGILTPIKKHNYCTVAVCIGATLNFFMNLVLIPRYYAIGATIATIIAETAVTIVYLFFCRSFIDFKSFTYNFINKTALAIIMAIVVYLLGIVLNSLYFNTILITIVQIISGIAIYVFELFITKDKSISIAYEIMSKRRNYRLFK